MDVSTPSQSLGAIISNLALRRFIYSAYVLALLVVGATQVAVTSLGLTNPDRPVATLAVLGYLGAPGRRTRGREHVEEGRGRGTAARRRDRGTAAGPAVRLGPERAAEFMPE